jgi:Flp pilus assembly protein TadG
MSKRWQRWRDEDGAELVEFAFVLPTLLLLIVGVVDFGLLFQKYEVVTNAAREGARVAILPGYGTADVTARVNQYLTTGGLNGTATVSVGAPQALSVGSQCITVRPVTVSYQHQFLFIGPMLTFAGLGSLADKTLNATSAMRDELAAAACP